MVMGGLGKEVGLGESRMHTFSCRAVTGVPTSCNGRGPDEGGSLIDKDARFCCCVLIVVVVVGGKESSL